MSTVEERYRALANKLGEYVSLIQAGEEQYFANLYEESLSYAFYSAKRYVKNEEDCKDIVQEGFIKVFYNLNTLQDVNKYLPWMKRIMINLSINFLKERRPDLFLDYWEKEEDFYQSDFIPKTESSEAVMITDESRQILEHLISLLSEKHATILQLFYFDNLTIPEIATLLGIKEGTVKSRLFTARNNLKAATVAHEEKTGTRLYSLAALPLLFTNLDFSNVFRTVGQDIQEEIWRGIAGKIQFPPALETAKQAGRIGRAGQAATATKAGMSATAKSSLAVGLSIALAGAAILGFLLVKNQNNPETPETSASIPAFVSTEGTSAHTTIDETTSETVTEMTEETIAETTETAETTKETTAKTAPVSQKTTAPKPAASGWAQYTNVFKSKIVEVNANRKKLIGGVDDPVGEVEWAIVDIGDNKKALPELLIRIPYTYAGSNMSKHSLGLTLIYRLEGNDLVLVGDDVTYRWGTYLTDRKSVVYKLMIKRTEKPSHQTNDLYWMNYGRPANFLKSSTYASNYFTPDESSGFEYLYKNTHDLDQLLSTYANGDAAYQDGSLKHYTTTKSGRTVGVLFDEYNFATFPTIAKLCDNPAFLVVQYAPFKDYKTKVADVLKKEGKGMMVRPQSSADMANILTAWKAIRYGTRENP